MRKSPSKETTAMADHTPKPVPSRVAPDAVDRAVKSLLKWRSSKSEHEKPRILADDEFVYLILTLKKIPGRDRVNSYKIPLPHPLFDSATAELCLVLDDRPGSGLTKDDAAKKIAAESVPVSKVLKLSKLKSDYRPFEAKRKLCDSYDLFLADRRSVNLLPKLLGKEFFKKKKIPVPVDLRHKNWKEQIERACSAAQLFLRTGTCSVVRVARASMSPEQVVENVAAAIDGVAAVVPRQWGNVRSFHVKLLESLALPVYQSLPESRLRIDGGFKEVIAIEEAGKDIGAESAEKKEMKKKKKKTKGRIHEVRYMDGNEDESDGDEIIDDDISEDLELMKKKKKDDEGVEKKTKKKKRDRSVSSEAEKVEEKKKKSDKTEKVEEKKKIGGKVKKIKSCC